MSTELKARLFDFQKDYPEVCEWWEKRGHRYVEKNLLSKIGIMIESDVKYCVGWLYTGDSAFGKFTWVATNPDSPLMKRKEALALLSKSAVGMSRDMGLESIVASFTNKNISKIFEENGFGHVERNVTNLIARL